MNLNRINRGQTWRVKIIRFLICVLLVSPVLTQAAQAPKSKEELQKNAALIVSGSVVEISSYIAAAKVDKGIMNKDKFFTIKVKITKVLKGAGVKTDETITVEAWKAYFRLPLLPGPQGHGPIPKKGDNVTFYLNAKSGKVFKPILPNGIVIEKKE